MKQSLSSINELTKQSTLDNVHNLLEENIRFDSSDMEEQLLSRNSVMENSASASVDRGQYYMNKDGSFFDVQNGSASNLLNTNLTVSSQKSQLKCLALTNANRCVRKIKKHKVDKFRYIKHQPSEYLLLNNANNLPVKENPNLANNRFISLKQRPIVPIAKNGPKKRISSLASLDKLHRVQFTMKPKFLALGPIRTVPHKHPNKFHVTRQSTARLFIAKVRELIGLLNCGEKLEGQDFSTERSLVEKCAIMVTQKLKKI